jgi:glycogen debranching enzyme
MQGTPSYIASLWIGALRAAVRIAKEVGKTGDEKRWTELLDKASASFDHMLFNGEYFSLWADGNQRDELCMTDQVSGEWFTHLIGLPMTTSAKNLDQSIDSIFRNNFNPEFGLHNATAPRRGAGLLALNNLHHGRFPDGVEIVEAIHRRYLRAGQPFNHVECGGHYSRAMSSWATMLAATGFKPDAANKSLAVLPAVPGDFRAPWVTASGFGSVSRKGQTLSIHCAYGKLEVNSLKLRSGPQSIRIGAKTPATRTTKAAGGILLEFSSPLSLAAGQTLSIS